MTVSIADVVTVTNGSGGLVHFPYTFPIEAASELAVTLRHADGTETAWALGVDYAVNGVGDALGGTITPLLEPYPLSTDKVIVQLAIDFLQGQDFNENEGFPALVHENAHDKRARGLLQLQGAVDRAALVRPGDATAGTLPLLAARQGNFPMWDANGRWTAVAGLAPDDVAVSAAVAPALAAGDVNGAATSALHLLGVHHGLHAVLAGDRGQGRFSVFGSALNYADWQGAVIDAGNNPGVDSAPGVNGWIVAALAAGVNDLWLDPGHYHFHAPCEYLSGLKLRAIPGLTTFEFHYCNGFVSAAPGARVTDVELEGITIVGKDDQEFEADGSTPNTVDHTAVDFRCTQDCVGRRLTAKGWSLGFVINGQAGAAAGASRTRFEDCDVVPGALPHGNNAYPNRGFRTRGDLAGFNRPFDCRFDRCRVRYEANTAIQTYDGDGAQTAFPLTALFQPALHAGEIVVDVDGVLQTLTTHYTLTGLGTTTPTVTFVTAPGAGVDNVVIRFVPYADNAIAFDFKEAFGCSAINCSAYGVELGMVFDDCDGCYAAGGFMQNGNRAFDFKALAQRNRVDIMSFQINELTFQRIVQDVGQENHYLPNMIVDSRELGAGIVATATSFFAHSADTEMQPSPAICDKQYVYRFQREIRLSQNGGAPAELSVEFGLVRYDPLAAIFVEVSRETHVVSTPGTAAARKFVSITLVDDNPHDKRYARNPIYRLGYKLGANSRLDIPTGGGLMTLSEEHVHAV